MKKKAVSDVNYTLAELPHTRREVFVDVVKLYGRELVNCGLILLVFALPMLIVNFEKSINLLSWTSGDIGKEELEGIILSDGIFSTINVIGYAIFFIGLSGAARVIRQLAWEEPVYLRVDFPNGIRQNVKSYLFLGLLTGCWVLLSRYCAGRVLLDTAVSVLVNFLPTLLGMAVLLPVLLYGLAANAVYANPFGGNLRVALLLYLKHPLKSLLLALLLCLPLLVGQILPGAVLQIVVQAAAVVFTPLLLLVWFLWSFDRMDEVINRTHYPELVGKGLVREEAEEGPSN